MAIIYKGLSKTEISQDAGVSIGTVRSWCKQKEAEMRPYGYTPKSRNLSPACVKILAEHYCFTPRNAIIV